MIDANTTARAMSSLLAADIERCLQAGERRYMLEGAQLDWVIAGLRALTAPMDRDRMLAEALSTIVALDQRERQCLVEFDPAGSTYEVKHVDGPCAKVARDALGPFAETDGKGQP